MTTSDLNPCAETDSYIFDGETEDYCLNLIGDVIDNTATANAPNINIIASPNPFKDAINLKTDLPTSDIYQARIVNVLGETILRFDDFHLDEAIDLSSISSSGIYFLIIENDFTSYNIKLLKQD